MTHPTKQKQPKFPVQMRLDVAQHIMAGLVSNPAIIASNSQNGWELVNCSYGQLAQMAVDLADQVIAASHTQVDP